MKEAPYRKRMRLQGFDYAEKGCYFITICTLNRRNILGEVVGGDAHIAPSVLLSEYGQITDKYIKAINEKYENYRLDKYVVMPNHIHMLITIIDGAMWASPPTGIPGIIRSFKTLVSKKAGISLFQESYFDHIIRDQDDYHTKWNYIDTNPARWAEDKYYVTAIN